MTEPRDLTNLVPADIWTELAAVVAALELHGPAVTKALGRLDRATTAAWNAVHPANPTEDEWRLVERAVGIDRGWNAAYRLVSTLDPPRQGRAPPNGQTVRMRLNRSGDRQLNQALHVIVLTRLRYDMTQLPAPRPTATS